MLTHGLAVLTALTFSAMPVVHAETRTVHKGVMVLEDNQLQAAGQADYVIESRGRLQVKGHAEAPALRLSGLKFDRTYTVAPENLLSARYRKVGASVPFHGLTLKVIEVDAAKKLSTALGKNEKGEVTFVFDTSRRMIDLQRISWTSPTMPIPLNLKRAG